MYKYSIKYKNISIDASLASVRKGLYTRKVHWKMFGPVNQVLVRSHSDHCCENYAVSSCTRTCKNNLGFISNHFCDITLFQILQVKKIVALLNKEGKMVILQDFTLEMKLCRRMK